MNINDITFGLMTSQNTKDRAAAILLTWGKDIPNLYFVTDEESKESRFLNLSKGRPGIFKPTDYRSNTEKQIELIKYLAKECKPTPWYFLGDDDTYIYVDHVLELLKDKKSRKPVYAGKMINYCQWDPSLIYASGGAGFILNKKALKLLAKQWSNKKFTEEHIINNIYADVAQGFALKEQGVKPTLCEWHISENYLSRSWNINDHVPYDQVNVWEFDKFITYHRITAEQTLGMDWKKWKKLDKSMDRLTPYRQSKKAKINISKAKRKKWEKKQNEI